MDSTIAIPTMPASSESHEREDSHSNSVQAKGHGRRWGQRWPFGWLSLGVLALLTCLAIVTSLVTQSVVRDQERRLLHERAGEVASTVSVAIGSVQSSLSMLSRVAALSHNSRSQFAAAAAPLIDPGVEMIGVAAPRPAGYIPLVSAGPAAASAPHIRGQLLALLSRASVTPGMVTGLLKTRQGTELGVAVRGSDDAVVYELSAIYPARPTPATPGSPYSELAVMLYASTRAEPSQLVLTTTTAGDFPRPIDRRLVAVGADKWLLITSSRQPLVGSFASEVPWIVLGAFLFGAILVAALVELLTRGRRYALGLVEERTLELQEAFERQRVLEQEQRDARKVAEKANRAKSEFLSRMSHELRTPLNAILGFGQLLELDELSDRQRENVKYIMKGGGHLLELINEVLELARIESGQLALSPESVPLAETVNETIALVQPLAAAQGIALQADLSGVGADAHVHADRQRLKQVILNLLSNAIKYNRADGRVDVTAMPVGPGRVRISVTDTGIGIDPHHLARVFEPFDRLGAETGEVEGTGLGLALSKRLIEAMDGSIAFESEPGQGTTFSLDLTRADRPGAGEFELHPGGDDALSASHDTARQLLYIEDNLSNVTLVERILELEPGLELLPAMQARLGLDLAHQLQPDLIMLDLHLPDMGGEEVLRRLKSDPGTSHIPVVVLSADASKGQISRLLDLGASDYLTKPLMVQRFRQVLAAQLGASLSSAT